MGWSSSVSFGHCNPPDQSKLHSRSRGRWLRIAAFSRTARIVFVHDVTECERKVGVIGLDGFTNGEPEVEGG